MGRIIHIILDIVLVLVSTMKIVGGDGEAEDYFIVYGILIIVVLDVINMIIKRKKARGDSRKTGDGPLP